MERIESSGPDICPICGEPVKRENLPRHFKKVHPRRASSFQDAALETARSRSRRTRPPRRLLFYALIGITIIVISVAVGGVISSNTVRMSIQLKLSVFIRGAPFSVPAKIGIDPSLWKDHSLDRFGVGGHSPLHTDDDTGAINVESNTVRNFTLHEFLAVWGTSVDSSQVVGNLVQPGESSCVFVGQQPLPSVTEDVVLSKGLSIVLEIPSGNAPCSAVG